MSEPNLNRLRQPDLDAGTDTTTASIGERLRAAPRGISVSLGLRSPAESSIRPGSQSGAELDCAANPASTSPTAALPAGGRVVQRGDYCFHIAIARGRDGRPATLITVAQRGAIVGRGTLEMYSEAYQATRRFAAAFRDHAIKPVGKIGDIHVGPDAARAIAAAIQQELALPTAPVA